MSMAGPDDLKEADDLVEYIDGDEVDALIGDDSIADIAADTRRRHSDDDTTGQAKTGDNGKDDVHLLLEQERAARQRAERERDDIDVRARYALAGQEVETARIQRDSARGMIESVDAKIRSAREAVKAA